jgi:GNAT superfamily N-acetyltransferase
MNPHIREARTADAATIAEFNIRMAMETEQLALEPATVDQGVRAALADRGKGTYYVAEMDGTLAGQLMITHEWSDWRNGDLWWIQSVYVRPNYRRCGVFKALYRHVQQAARDAHAAGVRLYVERDNHAAQQSYARLGMSLTHYAVMEEMF